MSWNTGLAWVGPTLKVPVSAIFASGVPTATARWRALSQTSSEPSRSRRKPPKPGEAGPWSTRWAALVQRIR